VRNHQRPLLAISAAAAAALITACGGSTQPATHPSAPASPAGLTAAQGAQICNDLNAWIPGAENQDQPRFNATLETDETEAVSDGSQLGNDLPTEDRDLQEDNSLAMMTGVINNESGTTNTAALSNDCSAYGVTLTWGS
jgi:hypothetical protein